MRPCLILSVLALVLSGCVAPDGPAEGLSESGDYRVVIPATRWVTGWNDIPLEIYFVYGGDRDDELINSAGAYPVEMDVTMPAMGHGSSEEVELLGAGDSLYTLTAFFQMPGAWEITGAVSPEDRPLEAFSIPIDVVEQ